MGMGDIDRRLVRPAQDGGRHALEALFRHRIGPAHPTACRLTGNLAEDISQETFARAFRGIDGFEQRSGFRTLLCRILFHVAQDFSKKRAKGLSGASV